MSGLLSANIALYPHQVEVIRRVLEDPIQRYLLADEGGLGKTIEAGVILRQFLLDEPKGTALILVPLPLLHQWQQELEQKFSVGEFGDRVTLIATSDWEKIPPTSYDFTILAQAERVAAMSYSPIIEEKRCFTTIQTLAHDSERLLLLSAAPLLNHEREFLAMLHLLDPDNYQLEDLDGFRDRVQQRQAIGRVLLSCQEGTNQSILQENLAKLESIFPGDPYLCQMIQQLPISLESGAAGADLCLRAIRTHISDTYRLHRRMLRNRSATVTNVICQRHAVPRLEYDLDERCYDLFALLEQWRTNAPDRPEYHHIFRLLVETSNTWLEIFKQVVQSRLNGFVVGDLNADLGDKTGLSLTKTPKFAPEQAILQDLLKVLPNPCPDGDRLELLKIVLLYYLADILKLQSFRSDLSKLEERTRKRIERPFSSDIFPKIVIFTSYTQAAAAIVQLLSQVFGEKAVASHSLRESRQQVEANLKRFQTHPQCFLLVCDPSAEEGTNLQFVDGVIHFDLPFCPNKLEQRLGRVDRIDSKSETLAWVLVGIDSPDSYQDAWYQMLKDGWRIFNESIASLQFYVGQQLPELEKILFQKAGQGLINSIPNLKKDIDRYKMRINEQNILDEMDCSDRISRQYFQTLEAYDCQHKIIEKATEGWLCGVLNFRKKYDVNMKDVRSYRYTDRTLVSVAELKEKFSDSVVNKGVYNRLLSNQYTGVHIYRIGERLIDILADYISGDDRGTAFAMWRRESTWRGSQSSEWLGFRFDYVLATDWKKIKTVLQDLGHIKYSHSAIKRQVDALFPPQLKTLFIDINGGQVTDEELIKILRRPYKAKGERNRDYNLAKERRFIVDGFINPERWESLCYEVRNASEKILLDSCSDYCQHQVAQAGEILEHQIDQLKLRLRRISEKKLSQEIEQQTTLNQVLLESISRPHVRLDAVGFIIISENPPAEIGQSDGDLI
jgi:ATP-dependent helicase HepA